MTQSHSDGTTSRPTRPKKDIGQVSGCPGATFRAAVAAEKPLQVVGAVNAYAALLAEHSGFKALYLSGGGVAASSCGIPDLGITTLEDVLVDARRITDVTPLPLLVDIDTGWGGAFNIARAIRALDRAGVAAVHIEDQVMQKRCGHRPGKAIVSQAEMVDRVKAAVDARIDPEFVIMARTDALQAEGLQAAIDRAGACVEAGADMIFPEAMTELAQYQAFARAVKVPILANITEFGATPLFTVEELRGVGVGLVLYPLSAFRASAKAALNVYGAIRNEGTQKNVLDTMQTRMELYDHLGYHAFEEKLDALFVSGT
jgi:methylisocitrate lyase